MPQTTKQRRAAFAELSSRKQGKSLGMFKGMKEGELDKYAHSPKEKKGKSKGKHPPFSAADQGEALR